MLNTEARNTGTPQRIQSIARWHHDRNLIDGATDVSQFDKLIEEMLELRLSISPGMAVLEAVGEVADSLAKAVARGKLKPAQDRSGIKDDIGDISVVLINIAERNGLTFAACLNQAYDDIKDRKGEMIDGVFVKEADL